MASFIINTSNNNNGNSQQPMYVLPIDQETANNLLTGNQQSIYKDREISDDKFLQEYWRPMMAVLYLVLCFLDYGIRPAVNYIYQRKFDLSQTVELIRPLDPNVQIQIITMLKDKEVVPPIMNEMVHVAFGGILTAAAWTRGQEKLQKIKDVGKLPSSPIGKRKISPGPDDDEQIG